MNSENIKATPVISDTFLTSQMVGKLLFYNQEPDAGKSTQD